MLKENYKPALQKMLSGTREERVFLAEQSFGLFCLYYFSDYFKYALADYHYELFQDFEDLVNNKIRELVWIIYREGGKTTLEKLGHIWILTYKKRMYPNADAFDKENAERILFDIAFELVNNKRFQADFGILFSKSKSVDEIKQNRINNFITQNGVRVEAHSTQESVRGRLHLAQRPDFLSLDDFETNKTKGSEAYTKQVRDHITEAMAGLAPNGCILYCCNYLSEYGNVQWLIDRAKNDTGIRVRNIPVIIDNEPAWPAKYALTTAQAQLEGKVSIEDKQIQLGSQVFSYEMMNMPIDDSLAEFKKEYEQTFDEEKLAHLNTSTYITVDTAISEKTSADFTGITINRVSQENKWYITAYKLKVNPKDLIEHLFTLHDRYKPSFFGIERTTFTMGIKPFLDDEMRKRGKFLNIKELSHTTQSKETRIRALIPRWESRSIFFVGNCNDLKEEMRTFPRGIHDDCIAEGNLVLTKKGQIPIENITTNDYVMTRGGFQRVLKIWDKGVFPVINNVGITGTADHRIITVKGEKHLCNVSASDILHVWNSSKQRIEKLSYIKAKNIIDTLTQKDITCDATTGDMINGKSRLSRYIDKFGLTRLVKYLKGFMYTIKMAIPSIMKYQTWNVYQQMNTQDTILNLKQQEKEQVSTPKRIIQNFKKLLNSGVIVKTVKNGIKNTLKKVLINLKKLFVSNVVNQQQDTQVIVNTAQTNVEIKYNSETLCLKTPITEKRVYDLMVENHHEFFVNGILVHNCLDSFAMQEEIAEKPIDMAEWDAILGNDKPLYDDIGL